MPDQPTPIPYVNCSVLREADYKPGTWLLSDRHNRIDLFLGNTDALVELCARVPRLEDMPSLMLVHEPGLGQQGAVFAKPLTPGTFTFGGNWLWSRDSRFPSPHPIPIHDAKLESE